MRSILSHDQAGWWNASYSTGLDDGRSGPDMPATRVHFTFECRNAATTIDDLFATSAKCGVRNDAEELLF
jgi:hypothetical protein